LNALTLAVNQPYFSQTGLLALLKILFDDARNIFRLKRMQVERILRRNLHRFVKWRFRFESSGIDSFFLVAFSHKKEGKKRLPSLGVNRNLALKLIPTLIAFQTAADFC